MNMKMYRHGDVIIKQVKSIPKEAQARKGLTLAEGEVTGHSHQISEGAASMFGFDDRMFLKVQSEIGALTHEEHSRIDLPAGNYEIVIQREHTPEGWKKVVD